MLAKATLRISGAIFLLVAIAHLVRLLFKVELTVGGYTIPLWVSAVGFSVLATLSFAIFKALSELK